ncbi:MAG: polysaccharide lyase 6 family protein [Planctomycetota bacterium]
MTSASPVVHADSIAALERAVADAAPGDSVVLRDGRYDEPCELRVRGRELAPVVIRPETPGGVTLHGRLKISGEHGTLTGFRFTGEGAVRIDGRGLRMTRCHMSNVQAGKWVRVEAGSQNVEIGYCLFENKQINTALPRDSQLMQIRVRNENERHYIHHNHFRDVPRGTTSNGFETLQLITERNPVNPAGDRSATIIEHNLFERCNGESEIVSIKSNGNLIRRNTFRDCEGSLVLRKGDQNVVSSNFFLGVGSRLSGGVRMQGTDHLIVNNYFQDLGGSALAMMDGTHDDFYVRVERVRILHNTIVRCGTGLTVGINHSKYPNGAIPARCEVAANLFLLENPQASVVQLVNDDAPEAWEWRDNIYRGELGIAAVEGLSQADGPVLTVDEGLARPTSGTPSVTRAQAAPHETDHDIFGIVREELATIGAIQFADERSAAGPLYEHHVGPSAGSSLAPRPPGTPSREAP